MTTVYPWTATHLILNWAAWRATSLGMYHSHVLLLVQGEDVSMGIWLSAVKPNYIDVCALILVVYYRRFCFVLSAWYAETCHLLFVCMFVGHAVNDINKVWQQISHTRVVRTGQNLTR